jgi:phosphotransacetylase
MDFLSEQAKRIQHSSTRVVFPEGNDERIINAATQIVSRGIAAPILLGKGRN